MSPTSLRNDSNRSNSAAASSYRPEQHVIVDQPEAAGEESAFAGRQAVHSGARVIAQHESVAKQLALDGRDGALDAGIVRRQKADHRNKQKARVQRRVAERLHERVLSGIKPMLAHFGMN